MFYIFMFFAVILLLSFLAWKDKSASIRPARSKVAGKRDEAARETR